MSKDTIYREDAINAVLRNLNKEEYRSSWESGAVKVMKDTLEKMPTADRPQGEWICHEGIWIDFDYYPTKYECNQCHNYVDVASDKNFCPNCGADMRGENNETDKEMR